MKFCSECGTKLNGEKFCPNCGNQTTTDNQMKNIKVNTNNNFSIVRVLLTTFVLLIGIIVFIAIVVKKDGDNYKSKNEYSPLDVNQLQKDYENNEISAADKYEGNFYYLTGTIHKVEHFITDDYLILQYKYSGNKYRTIEINAYFSDADKIKNVNKGDKVTVYCKFHKRLIESFGNTSSYSLHNCKF